MKGCRLVQKSHGAIYILHLVIFCLFVCLLVGYVMVCVEGHAWTIRTVSMQGSCVGILKKLARIMNA